MTQDQAPNVAPSSIPTPAALRRPTPTSASPAKSLADADTDANANLSSSMAFGRVDDDGTVYLNTPDGDVRVGQYAAGTPQEGLAFFARKYEDLVVEIDLVTARLGDGRAKPDQAGAVIERVRSALSERSFVGDIAALERKIADAESAREAAAIRQAEHRERMREQTRAAREALVTEAETLAESTSWKTTAERYSAIVDEWKALPRSDRSVEQELWKRLSSARSGFDKRRRAHFAQLDGERKEALARKRDLIEQAQKLADSTDWGPTTKALKKLMDDWKRAPRASRSDEDKLWKRFKAAQDSFYSAMKAADSARDAELTPNVAVKEELLTQAEGILPLSPGQDLSSAKRTLRSIQDKWEKAGDVPRSERSRLEGRLRKVEDAVRKADSQAWQQHDPEKQARAESTANAFTDALMRQEAELADAQAKGDSDAVRRLEQTVESTRALLEAAQRIAR
jgi:hypothetical protein